jgi:hypothetical protein
VRVGVDTLPHAAPWNKISAIPHHGSLLDVGIGGKVQVEIRRRGGHELCIREARVFVRRRVAADAERLAHGVLDARGGEIRGARAALTTVTIDGDGESSVALTLDGFELAAPDRRLPRADARLGLIGTGERELDAAPRKWPANP